MNGNWSRWKKNKKKQNKECQTKVEKKKTKEKTKFKRVIRKVKENENHEKSLIERFFFLLKSQKERWETEEGSCPRLCLLRPRRTSFLLMSKSNFVFRFSFSNFKCANHIQYLLCHVAFCQNMAITCFKSTFGKCIDF